MLVESKINDKKWLWVNIQKTATTSTLKTFFPEKEYNQQSHQIYVDLVRMYGYHDTFTMVRNPIDRFLSGYSGRTIFLAYLVITPRLGVKF